MASEYLLVEPNSSCQEWVPGESGGVLGGLQESLKLKRWAPTTPIWLWTPWEVHSSLGGRVGMERSKVEGKELG